MKQIAVFALLALTGCAVLLAIFFAPTLALIDYGTVIVVGLIIAGAVTWSLSPSRS